MAKDDRQTWGSEQSGARERETRPYSGLTLAELCQLIADSDFDALDELMEHRCPFEIANGRRIGFAAFLQLRQKQMLEGCRGYSTTVPIIERAFDLLMDHFIHRPDERDDDSDDEDDRSDQETNASESTTQDVESPYSDQDEDEDGDDASGSSQIDCRNYYRAYLDQVRSDFEKKPPVNETERELREAELLRRFVLHQLGYCLQEALRQANPLSSRYLWKTDEWKITVYFPKSFSGACRRKWLEEHIGRPDMSKPGEKKRIQALIDEEFGRPTLVPMPPSSKTRPAKNQSSPLASIEKAELQGMRRFIAEEKAARIKDQPRKIRELGKRKLRRLVLVVLENWDSEEKSGADLAREFGLSTPTFSRFAGRNRRGKKAILVVNIARIMKANPVFLEAARHAGFLKRIVRIAEGGSEGGPHGT